MSEKSSRIMIIKENERMKMIDRLLFFSLI